MDYIQLSKFGALTGALFILIVYIYLYFLYRERYMGVWIISWTVFFTRILFLDSGLRKIIQRHRGKAWLVGKVNAGAVFSFSFPKDLQTQHAWPVPVLPDNEKTIPSA